ncbi:hypothetical protein Trydic_g4874, partial [Trypoxylus dichotomus]
GDDDDIASNEIVSPSPFSEATPLQAQLDSPPSRSANTQSCPEGTQSQPTSSQSGIWNYIRAHSTNIS